MTQTATAVDMDFILRERAEVSPVCPECDSAGHAMLAPRGRASLRVLVCSDVRIFREGLARALADDERCTMVATASAGEDCVLQARAVDAEVVVLDTATTAGTSFLRDLRRRVPSAAVIALGVRETEDEVVAYAEAGVAGYVARDQALDDLLTALDSVARGEAPCPPRTATMLLRAIGHRGNGHSPGLLEQLTGREREIVDLIGDGLSNKQIGQRLCIELATVKNHVHNILEKLQVAGRREAAALVIRARR